MLTFRGDSKLGIPVFLKGSGRGWEGSVATNSWHGTTTFGTGAQLWEIPPVRGGFVPRGKANGQAAPPTGNNYGILPPARADRPVPNVADLPNVGSNAS